QRTRRWQRNAARAFWTPGAFSLRVPSMEFIPTRRDSGVWARRSRRSSRRARAGHESNEPLAMNPPELPEHRARFAYSPDGAQRAYLSSLWSRSAVLLVLSTILLAWAISAWRSADYGPLAGCGVGVVLLLWVAWLGGYRRAGRAAAALGNPE